MRKHTIVHLPSPIARLRAAQDRLSARLLINVGGLLLVAMSMETSMTGWKIASAAVLALLALRTARRLQRLQQRELRLRQLLAATAPAPSVIAISAADVRRAA